MVVVVAAAVLRGSREGCPEGAKLVGPQQEARRRQDEVESSFFQNYGEVIGESIAPMK